MQTDKGWDEHLIELSKAIRMGDREVAETALDVMIRDRRDNAPGAVESVAYGWTLADAALRRRAA